MPTPSEAYLRDLLAETKRDLAQAEQRRERQANVVSGLRTGTDARTYAERVLGEIDRTIALIHVNHEMTRHFSA